MPTHPNQIGYYVFMPRAIEQGWSQRGFFEWARSKEGIWTARDSTMRAVWNRLDANTGYRYRNALVRDDQLIPKSTMSPLLYEGRTMPYTYTVSYNMVLPEGGLAQTRRVSVLSENQLTKGQVFGRANEWIGADPDTYGEDVSDMAIDMVEDAELGFIGQ